MTFRMAQKVLFRHCDPAGIVFYPRYFEMMNDCVEAWFAGPLGHPFERMLPDFGVPTVSFEAAFRAPSRLGDRLDIALTPERLGRTSLHLEIEARAGGEQRFHVRQVLVLVNAAGKPVAWPAPLRMAIEGGMATRTV